MSADGIDRTALERLQALGGQDFVAEMLDLALGNIADQLSAGRKAASQDDAKGVAVALHSIAGSAGNIGAVELEELARQGLARDASEAVNLTDELKSLQVAFQRVRPLLLEAQSGRE